MGWHIRRISGAGEDVSAGVTSEGEVAPSVYTIHSISKVSLHNGLEPVDVRILCDEC